MDYKIEQLKKFLFNANANGYAANNQRIMPQRPNFKELDYSEGDWYFRDSYAGWYMAPGQEVIYYKNKPIWAMSYTGGMKIEYHNNSKLAEETFNFLKESLLKMNPDKPFRGPTNYKRNEWCYIGKVKGDIKDFTGNEKIYYKNDLLFEQNFIGGIIIDK
jgi:hypothetical protein